MGDYKISVGRYARLTSLPNNVYTLKIHGENVRSTLAAPIGGNRTELLNITAKYSPLTPDERSGLSEYLILQGVPC